MSKIEHSCPFAINYRTTSISLPLCEQQNQRLAKPKNGSLSFSVRNYFLPALNRKALPRLAQKTSAHSMSAKNCLILYIASCFVS